MVPELCPNGSRIGSMIFQCLRADALCSRAGASVCTGRIARGPHSGASVATSTAHIAGRKYSWRMGAATLELELPAGPRQAHARACSRAQPGLPDAAMQERARARLGGACPSLPQPSPTQRTGVSGRMSGHRGIHVANRNVRTKVWTQGHPRREQECPDMCLPWFPQLSLLKLVHQRLPEGSPVAAGKRKEEG